MRGNSRLCLLLSALMLVGALGCSKKQDLSSQSPEEAYRYLERQFDKKRYMDAADGLDFFTLNYSGSSLVDSAQYLLGRCHFEMKEYLIAASVFDGLTRRFPSSTLVADAMFNIGLSYWRLSPKYSLDQEYTLLAIDAFQSFIDYYPARKSKVALAQDYIDSCREKLSHKEYVNGLIYLKMKDYTSALIYFHWILDLFYDTEWAPKAAFQIGVVHTKEDNTTEAAAAFQAYLTKYPDHEWVDKAELALEKIRETEN